MKDKVIYYNIYAAFLFLCIGLMSLQPSATESAKPSIRPMVVTTIKPLAIIARSAVGDAAEVEYLLPGNQAPHDFAPPASGLRKMAQADLVLWVGPGFETRSAKTIQRLPSAKRIAAIDFADEPQGSSPDDQHNHSLAADPHIWLNPNKANKIAAQLQAHLGLPIAAIISQQKIAQLEQQLAADKDKTYLSHHDAYGHFAEAFGLAPGLSIRDASGEVQGAKSQYQLRKNIASANVSCIFVEPQYQDKDASVIADEFGLALIQLDPQGMAQSLNNNAYLEFIDNLVEQFKVCYQ